MRRRAWTHYAAPAAFLLAATIAILLVRAGINHGGTTTTAPVLPSAPRKTVATAPAKRTTKPTTAGPRFYTVVAGDTFEVISSKTHVPVARIQRLNPNVQSTALYIGEKIRIR